MNKKAFTLLELLIVVLIISILVAIALPQYKIVVGKAKFSTLKDNARIIKEAMTRFYLINNQFPDNLEELDINIGSLSSDKKTVYFNSADHNCSVGTNAILCRRKISGISMEYGVSKNGNTRSCVASADINDLSNKICKLETGRDETTYPYSTYTSYMY